MAKKKTQAQLREERARAVCWMAYIAPATSQKLIYIKYTHNVAFPSCEVAQVLSRKHSTARAAQRRTQECRLIVLLLTFIL